MIPWGHAARLNDADNLDRQSQLLAGSPSHRESLDPGVWPCEPTAMTSPDGQA